MLKWTVPLVLLLAGLSGCIQDAGDIAGTLSAPIGPQAAAATIVWSPESPDVKQTVRFAVDTEGDVSDISWTFGDGTGVRAVRADHAFHWADVFQVSASIAFADGTSTRVHTNVPVGTQDDAPTPTAPDPAGTGAEEPEVTTPPVIFVDQDGHMVTFSFDWQGTPSGVEWQFGDGKSSTEVSPTHAYRTAGTYQVRLTVEAAGQVLSSLIHVIIDHVPFTPHVIVGVTDTGINPYHELYYRPDLTAHPCTWLVTYDDCSVEALQLSVGPGLGSYEERLRADSSEWNKVRAGEWYWIPKTSFIAVHCPTGGGTQGGVCILDDESTHGTGTTSSVLTEAPDALLVFNEGSSGVQLATSPVPFDIESNSWGSLAPLYGGLVNGPTGTQICHDSVDLDTSIKFRSAGNNGPVPNMGDCWRNGWRTYSVAGGYPNGEHHALSGSAPDFASYMCRPVAATHTTNEWRNACGTSFAAPTAAGTAAAALLQIRQELGHAAGNTPSNVAPGISHEAFMDAVIAAATYDPEPRAGFDGGSAVGTITGQTPWYWWGWGWLDVQVADQIVDCALGRHCPDNKSSTAWQFNDVRRSFASDGDPSD